MTMIKPAALLASLVLAPLIFYMSPHGGDAFLKSPGKKGPSPICVMTHSAWPMLKCLLDGECRKYLVATMKCQMKPASQMCPCVYVVQMQGTKCKKFTDFVSATLPCLTDCPQDGTCLATNADALQNITTLDQVAGDWWVLRGVNCGQGVSGASLDPTPGKSFPGAYDWLPCQHERVVKSTGHDYPHPTSPWVNNITYCGGTNGGIKQCTSPIIDTVANISMVAPGVVFHDYTDAPVHPQQEYWRIVSYPHPDYMFMLWCGSIRTTFLKYNGGIVLSKNRNDEGMPVYVKDAFAVAAAKHGIVWDQMCPSTNDGCP